MSFQHTPSKTICHSVKKRAAANIRQLPFFRKISLLSGFFLYRVFSFTAHTASPAAVQTANRESRRLRRTDAMTSVNSEPLSLQDIRCRGHLPLKPLRHPLLLGENLGFFSSEVSVPALLIHSALYDCSLLFQVCDVCPGILPRGLPCHRTQPAPRSACLRSLQDLLRCTRQQTPMFSCAAYSSG